MRGLSRGTEHHQHNNNNNLNYANFGQWPRNHYCHSNSVVRYQVYTSHGDQIRLGKVKNEALLLLFSFYTIVHVR